MKNMFRMLSSIVIAVTSATASNAQAIESNPAAYEAYLNPVADAQQAWAALVSSATADLKTSANDDAKFKLGLAQYGLLNATMRSKDEATFNKYVDGTIANLESITEGHHLGESMALLAAVYGLQMAYDQSKGMFLGPRSNSLLSKARKAEPSSPLVWRLYANSMLHTPEAYGGDVVEAISAYEKSISLYEASPDKTKNNWMYIDAMAFLGQAYTRNNESPKAVVIYEKALGVEPSFDWVKNNLLPAAQAKAK